jgi:hypothetical protein
MSRKGRFLCEEFDIRIIIYDDLEDEIEDDFDLERWTE